MSLLTTPTLLTLTLLTLTQDLTNKRFDSGTKFDLSNEMTLRFLNEMRFFGYHTDQRPDHSLTRPMTEDCFNYKVVKTVVTTYSFVESLNLSLKLVQGPPWSPD